MDAIIGLDRRALERARVSRDPRFDGRFFIAVTSTGIYCRPICPAPMPKEANVRYYASAASAAEAGFRPCLRCRPEAAPGTPAWMGTSTVVRRALRLIDDGALDEGSVEALAARVGIGARQLHRLFVEHVGASPITVAQTRRLHFAKRLLDETALPVTEIALAAGFGSVRRFNDAFQKTYRRAPRDLRRLRHSGVTLENRGDVVLRLAYRPPYEWTAMCHDLAERAVPSIERIDGNGYMRTVATAEGHALIGVHPLKGADALELRVRGAPPGALFQLSATVRRIFDLASEPALVEAVLSSDPMLAPRVKRHRGLRIPGAWNAFECGVRAIVAERVSRATARRLAGRLVDAAGIRISSQPGGLTHLFPTPAALASARFDGLGFGVTQVSALRAIARLALEGGLDGEASVENVVAALRAVPGFGARAAQDVALYALGDPDAFPAADLVLRRAVSSSKGVPASPGELEARAESWRPWRGYAALHVFKAARDAAEASAPRDRKTVRLRKMPGATMRSARAS